MEGEEQLGLGDASIKEFIPLKGLDHRSYKPNPEHTQGQALGRRAPRVQNTALLKGEAYSQ